MSNMRLIVTLIVIEALGTVPKDLKMRTGRVRNQRMNRDQTGYTIFEIALNTEKSPGDLRKLRVIQTPVKDHQLTLV